MSPLVKIRSERDRMSAVERRVADFILENARLLRDYSSQQLADALGISQSSVVKFTQKLGYRGYPDLKYAVGAAIGAPDDVPGLEAPARPESGALWLLKGHAVEATHLINGDDVIQAAVHVISGAGKVFVFGTGDDDLRARGFSQRLAMIGIVAMHHPDLAHLSAQLALAGRGDALVLLSEHGRSPALPRVAQHMHEQGGLVISLTRHSGNALRHMADIPLAVVAHDDAAHVQSLLYQSAAQHMLDDLFLRLCESDEARRALWHRHTERIQRYQDT